MTTWNSYNLAWAGLMGRSVDRELHKMLFQDPDPAYLQQYVDDDVKNSS